MIIAHAMVMSPLSRGRSHCQPPSGGRLDQRTGVDLATVSEPWPELDVFIAPLHAARPGWRL